MRERRPPRISKGAGRGRIAPCSIIKAFKILRSGGGFQGVFAWNIPKCWSRSRPIFKLSSCNLEVEMAGLLFYICHRVIIVEDSYFELVGPKLLRATGSTLTDRIDRNESIFHHFLLLMNFRGCTGYRHAVCRGEPVIVLHIPTVLRPTAWPEQMRDGRLANLPCHWLSNSAWEGSYRSLPTCCHGGCIVIELLLSLGSHCR